MRYSYLLLVFVLSGCDPGANPSFEDGADTSVDPSSADDVASDVDPETRPEFDAMFDAGADADASSSLDLGNDPDPETDGHTRVDVVDASADHSDLPPERGSPMRPPPAEPTELFVGGHADDDLLFMNPDILTAIRLGNAVRTVIITGGDACGARDPTDREAGLRAAYGRMASGGIHREEDWICGSSNIGVPVEVCELDADPHMSLVFPRAPDCGSALIDLVDGRVDSIESVSPLPTPLTRAGLVELLTEELEELNVVTLHTLEASDVYGDDHDDHTASARLAYLAAAAVGTEGYREHRTYNVDSDPTNVHERDVEVAWDALSAYCDVSREGPHCARGTGVAFWEWSQRQYPIERLARFRGRIANGNRCLTPSAGEVRLGNCTEAPVWQVRDWNIEYEAGCLWQEDGELGVGVCEHSVFSMMSNGQIRANRGDVCLEAVDDTVAAVACRGREGGGPASSQVWHLAVGTLHEGGPFSDRMLDGAGSRSLQAGVGAFGLTELCVRAAEGLSCARFDGSRWSVPAVLTFEFSSALGWWPAARESTIRVHDLNGDGLPDACGRGVLGFLCGMSSRDGFGALRTLTEDTFFRDDAGGFWFDPAYYRSIGFAQLGAEWPHLCVRTTAGVSCAPPTGEGTWGLLIDVIETDFSNGLGWHRERYGSTIRYGDIYGDGLDDVCGRGLLGLYCALGTEEGFFRSPRFWGFRDQLSDHRVWPTEERYAGSFQLVDINTDGRADACLRSPAGLICGWSTGSTFDAMLPLHAFADEDGFSALEHGVGIVWDTASRRVCARRSDGLVCAEL